MLKPKLQVKFVFIISFILVLFIVLLNIRMSVRFSNFSRLLVNEKLASSVNNLNFRLEESRNNSITAAVSMAQSPAVIKAIRERNRTEILRLFTEAQTLYRVNFYTIADHRGVALVRTHDPDNYYDLVLNQRNISLALEGEISTWHESGNVVKVSVRTGCPVYDTDGTLIGAISAGVRFDTNETVDEFKKILNADVCVFYEKERVATTIMQDGMRMEGTFIDPDVAKIVFDEKKEFSGVVSKFGVDYLTYYKPLFNPGKEIFAVIVLGIPIDDLKKQARTLSVEAVIIGIMGFIICMIHLEAFRQAISANIAKSSFLANMSH